MSPVAPACTCDMHRFTSPETLAAGLAREVATELVAAIQVRGTASLAVSGGRSPIAFFNQLRQQAIPWSQVVVVLVDERCVPAGHADRNADLVRQHLLQGAAQPATFIDWLQDADAPEQLGPEALVKLASKRLSSVPWPLDVAVLGMGEDGHTASWFANSPGLHEALHSSGPLAWVRPVHAPHLRLTLTRQALQSCRHLHLSIAGTAKHQVLAQALSGNACHLPIHALLDSITALQVWTAH